MDRIIIGDKNDLHLQSSEIFKATWHTLYQLTLNLISDLHTIQLELYVDAQTVFITFNEIG